MMALPTRQQVHVNTPLTNMSVAYIQNQMNFIADRVFPMVPVGKQSDRYFVYNKSDFMRIEAKERAPSTESAGGGWNIDNTPTYFARPYAVHKDISDEIRVNADSPIQMDRDATIWITQQLMMKRERVWATNYFTTNVWDTDLIGGTDFTQWDDSTSTPIEDITEASIGVAEQTGFKPNKLVLSPYVFNALRHHPDVLDRIKYTQGPAITTPQIMAQLFDVDEVLVPYGVNDLSNEGASTLDMNFLFDKGALLVYANPQPSILTPSGGYIFTWTGLLGSGAFGTRIRNFRMEHIMSDRVEGDMAFDCKLVSSDVGVYFGDAVNGNNNNG